MKVYVYQGKDYSTLSDVRKAVQVSFPKNPDAAMLMLLGITEEERPDPAPETPSEEERLVDEQKRLTDLVQRFLDAKAQELNYDSCLSVCSYVDTGVQKFDDEGAAFRAWRSAVWEKGYAIVADVKAGKRGVPTEEELFAELPTLNVTYSAA